MKLRAQGCEPRETRWVGGGEWWAVTAESCWLSPGKWRLIGLLCGTFMHKRLELSVPSMWGKFGACSC